MASDAAKPPSEDHGGKITAKDVASATAVGAAARIGVARHKGKVGEGAGAGLAARSKRPAGSSNLVTAGVVIVVMIGMLALMIAAGK